MNYRIYPKLNRKGSALPLVIVVVLMLLLLGTGILTLGLQGRIFSSRTADRLAARAAADAGLTKALYELNTLLKSYSYKDSRWDDAGVDSVWDNTAFQVQNQQLPNSDATYSYKVTGSRLNGYTVEAVGECRNSTKTVRAELKLKQYFQDAVYAQNKILLKTDSYIDATGSAVATDPDGAGTFVEDTSSINGTITTKERDLSSVPPPDDATFDTDKGPITSTVTLNDSDSGTYSAIDISDDSTITIQGNVELYITGDISVREECAIDVTANSELTIYLGGNMDIRDSGMGNVITQESKRLTLIGVDDGGEKPVYTFADEPQFYGAIYAPDADIVMRDAQEMHGAIVADNVTMDDQSKFYYDDSLRNKNLDALDDEFVIHRWYEN